MSLFLKGISSFRLKRKEVIKAYTLVELLFVVAIIAILLSAVIPAVLNQLNKAKVTKARTDIYRISQKIEEYLIDYEDYPDSLAEVGYDYLTDPWGNPYKYLKIGTAAPGKEQKYYSTHPLNSDYDLYSYGRDGKTAPALTSEKSKDDIIRADGGRFIDLASKYPPPKKGKGKGKGK